MHTQLKHFTLAGFVAAALLAAGQYGKIRVTTTVKNGVVTSWNVGCPEPGKSSGTVYNMATVTRGISSDDADELQRLVSEIERKHGVRVSSKTRASKGSLKSDTINSNAVAPEGDAAAARLCDKLKSLK
ncbi:MAG: hypothetical protein FJW39_16205 [Acidobacteria bacterium]|nr:hypothetical protein [Acidobacteriota bacterium]